MKFTDKCLDFLIESYLQESIDNSILKIKIPTDIDHIAFEIHHPGEIIPYFMKSEYDTANSTIKIRNCGTTKYGKLLFATKYGTSNYDSIMKKVVKELHDAGFDKLKVSSYIMVHDTEKKYKVS